jgi:hypothetical protein
MELEENNKEIEAAIQNFQHSVEYAKYLQSHDKKSLDPDTIIYYKTDYYSSHFYTFKTNAFEMFKSSGIMRLMDNKELLLSIWDVYTKINELKVVLDEINRVKTEHILKEWETFDVNNFNNLHPENLKNPPMYLFHTIGIPINGSYFCEYVLAASKEMVIMLEKELNP